MTKGTGGMEVMMDDLVLTQEEVNPVMSALLDNGLEVTALHNHFFWDEPRMYYVHVHGHGAAGDLAAQAQARAGSDWQERRPLDYPHGGNTRSRYAETRHCQDCADCRHRRRADG